MNDEGLLLTELEKFREQLIFKINVQIDALKERIKNGDSFNGDGSITETIYPLCISPRLFKGTKPTAVYFGDEKVTVKKWRAAYTLILRRCADIPEMRDALMSLRNKISGRTRTVLSDKPDGMGKPIKITDEIFVEGYFDTEWLIKTLTVELLDVVRYDYSDISVSVVKGKRGSGQCYERGRGYE